MARLNVDVLVDVKGADKLNTFSSKLGRTGSDLTKFVTLPLVGAGVAAFKFASDASESMSKARTVFGKEAGRIETAAGNMNDAFSESQFLDTAGTFGQMAQAMGFTADESVDLSKQWLSMAQDFSSFNNLPIEDSLTAIRGAISGEFEPLKRMGILINQAKIQAKALELGLVENGEVLDDHSKALAVNALILEQSGAAQGDFARTADGAANSTKVLAADAIDLAADLGTQLLPIGIQLLTWVKQAFLAFNSLPQPIKDIIVPVLALVAGIGPLLLIGSKLIGTFKAIQAAFLILKVALLANPFIALAAAVIAIAALIILNWDKIVGFLKGVWDKITGGFQALAKALTGVWEGITSAVKGAWEGVINIIRGAINGIIDVINGLFGFLNNIQIGIPEINVGPVHVGGGTIDPFNIGLIPHLAEGGIIDGATLALLGENGPEAVVPLNKLPLEEKHFHSHIEVKGEDPFIRNPADLVRVQNRIAFLEGF